MNDLNQQKKTSKSSRLPGPGVLVAAAFVGPGTITACSVAGASFGFALVWALLFSIFSCLILQEMSVRLGVITGQGLGEALRSAINNRFGRLLVFGLVFSAILIGNSAYEGGNISGAVVGIQAILGQDSTQSQLGWSCAIGLLAYLLMMSHSYQLIEKVLIALVGIMSIAFMITFVLARPDMEALLKGFIPALPDGAALNVIALIGTTVVPYNLFLHAATVSKRWQGHKDLAAARRDSFISIGVGGLISIAILSTAAAVFFQQQLQLNSAADMALQLTPLLGKSAGIGLGLGLFAAGLSSAITAPLAAAYAICGIMGWRSEQSQTRFRIIWIVVLLCGVSVAGFGIRPLQVIWFAQITNGILLPMMALFLLYTMNQYSILGAHRNTLKQNILGALVIAVCLLLGGKSVILAISKIV